MSSNTSKIFFFRFQQKKTSDLPLIVITHVTIVIFSKPVVRSNELDESNAKNARIVKRKSVVLRRTRLLLAKNKLSLLLFVFYCCVRNDDKNMLTCSIKCLQQLRKMSSEILLYWRFIRTNHTLHIWSFIQRLSLRLLFKMSFVYDDDRI